MLDLRKLRYFLMVAEELHFGRAALRLHLAQPPLTRQISALEAELGFKLFDRTSRTVALTAQGRAFLPYARGVLEQVELAHVIAGKLAAGTAGQLALGYVSSIALSDLFSQAIQAFAQRFPDVQLTLVECASGSLGAQVADGRLGYRLEPAVTAKTTTCRRCRWAKSGWWRRYPATARWPSRQPSAWRSSARTR